MPYVEGFNPACTDVARTLQQVMEKDQAIISLNSA